MVDNMGFNLCLLAVMFFCHIVDDYYLQSILASMKQRSWWEKNAPNALYKNDYKIALYEHAFSWSFMITLPLLAIALWKGNQWLCGYCCFSYIFNTMYHAYIDDLKANKHKINLITDQTNHFGQILVTWLFGLIFI